MAYTLIAIQKEVIPAAKTTTARRIPGSERAAIRSAGPPAPTKAITAWPNRSPRAPAIRLAKLSTKKTTANTGLAIAGGTPGKSEIRRQETDAPLSGERE